MFNTLFLDDIAVFGKTMLLGPHLFQVDHFYVLEDVIFMLLLLGMLISKQKSKTEGSCSSSLSDSSDNYGDVSIYPTMD